MAMVVLVLLSAVVVLPISIMIVVLPASLTIVVLSVAGMCSPKRTTKHKIVVIIFRIYHLARLEMIKQK